MPLRSANAARPSVASHRSPNALSRSRARRRLDASRRSRSAQMARSTGSYRRIHSRNSRSAASSAGGRAAAADAVLAEKLQELENQRRALLSSAEPRLAALYAEHDSMEDEIQKMTEKK